MFMNLVGSRFNLKFFTKYISKKYMLNIFVSTKLFTCCMHKTLRFPIV